MMVKDELHDIQILKNCILRMVKKFHLIPLIILFFLISFLSVQWEIFYEKSKCVEVCQGYSKPESKMDWKVFFPGAGHQDLTCKCFTVRETLKVDK